VIMGIFIFIVHKKAIPALMKRKITGKEGLIGIEGEVIESLEPAGVIKIGGEYWKARAVGGNIKAGETVEVVSVNRLVLTVKPGNREA
jgi:membrane-bound serine protease (ClpP class)